jgi:hypothetical protein
VQKSKIENGLLPSEKWQNLLKGQDNQDVVLAWTSIPEFLTKKITKMEYKNS